MQGSESNSEHSCEVQSQMLNSYARFREQSFKVQILWENDGVEVVKYKLENWFRV